MTVTERDRDLMRVLRSSFGLLGVVTRSCCACGRCAGQNRLSGADSLKDFTARLPRIVGAPGAVRLHISPFNDRITVERRTLDEKTTTRSGIWQIAIP
jgi:hypothetical protein